MKIDIERLGLKNVVVDPETLFTFPDGLAGFEACKRFKLFHEEGKTAVFWLQSVDDPGVMFPVVTPETLDTVFWIVVVFIYYILATLLPVDKIIGKIYPLFAIALLFMAVGILVMLYVKHPALPEVWDGLQNTHPNASALPVFPIMFVSIACGAISGFHATQSPLMARCMTSERHGRPIFYGAMITEGIVALIWAAAATCFFHENGMAETNAAVIVDAITKDWLGTIGGVLAILGVIAAPITLEPAIVHFALDKSAVDKKSGHVIDEFLAKAASYPNAQDFTFGLYGYTDSRASVTYNNALSKRRTSAVANYLIAKGVEASRISEFPQGENHLKRSGNDVKSHSLNRRVEIYLLKDGTPITNKDTNEAVLNQSDYSDLKLENSRSK